MRAAANILFISAPPGYFSLIFVKASFPIKYFTTMLLTRTISGEQLNIGGENTEFWLPVS
jgi:hypothetical protein